MVMLGIDLFIMGLVPFIKTFIAPGLIELAYSIGLKVAS